MQYRKKPVVIEALQYDGTNAGKILYWMQGRSLEDAITIHPEGDTFSIQTLEGTMTASIGDFVIKGVNGEFYPCKPDIFEKTYDKV